MRPAAGRPPGSSASYHLFSFFMDIGLIPFMVFTAFFAEENWSEAAGTDGRWRSFFSATGATDTLLFATFLIAVVVGALHLISIGFDLYLIFMFKKIAQFPPDLNPLDDGKSDKKTSKHKHKNSEATRSISEKKFSSLSGSTLHLSNPSHVSLNHSKLVPDANVRPMSFYQSRTNVDTGYSGHTLETARMSRVNLAGNATLYQQPVSARASRAEFVGDAQPRSQSRPRSQGRPHSFASSNRASYINQHDPMPGRPVSSAPSQNGPSRYSTPQPGPQASIPAEAAKLQQNDSLLNDNWYVVDDEASDLSSPRRTPLPESEDFADDEREPNRSQLRHARQESQDLLQQPLGMNPVGSPPLPPKSPARDQGDFYFDDMGHDSNHDFLSPPDNAMNESTIGRAISPASATSFYSQQTPDASRSPSPKRRFYGDLAAATRGVRGAPEPGVHNLPPPPAPEPEYRNPDVQTRHFETGTAVGRFLPEVPTPRGKSAERPAPGERSKSIGREQWTAGPGKARVISRSGADIADAAVMFFEDDAAGKKKARGRQVSGKIAEEGLGGPRAGSWWGMRKREVSGVA